LISRPRTRTTGQGGSEFEDFFELSEVACVAVGDEGHVLNADAADFRIIQSRLDRDDLPGSEHAARGRADAWRFVDFQAEAVAGAMEESLHATFAAAGLIAFLLKQP